MRGTSIDVIMPSYRLEEKYILPMLQLRRPAAAAVRFYLVADNPAVKVPAAIAAMANGEQVHLLVNEKNMGAPASRNRGIEVSAGEWILFLDDDIAVPDNLLETYAAAALQHSDETGFIGLVQLPPPQSDFTKAIQASGSMDIFTIAQHKASFAWGATANIMVKRSAVGDLRFSPAYPRSGGGEDVDFFLRVREKNGYRNFKTLPQAAVVHPWWNNEGINLRRPFRYGIGNSRLGRLNPRYTYYDFLNTPETLLLAGIATLALLPAGPQRWLPMLLFMAGAILIEVIAGAVQTLKRYPAANARIVLYTIALRVAHESGLLWGKLQRGEWWRIGERFHDNGVINKLYFYRTNTYRIVKWALYPLLVLLLLYML